MSMLTLYFLVKLDSLVSFLGWNVLFSVILFLVIFYFFMHNNVIKLKKIDDLNYFFSENKEERKKELINAFNEANIPIKKKLQKCFILFISVLFLYKAVPTTKEVAFIYIVGTLSQSETAHTIGREAAKIPEKAMQILNYHLEDYMKQFNSKKVQNKIAE